MEIGAALNTSMQALVKALETSTDQHTKYAKEMKEKFGDNTRGKVSRRAIDRRAETEAIKKVVKQHDNMYEALRTARAEMKANGEVSSRTQQQFNVATQRMGTRLGANRILFDTAINEMATAQGTSTDRLDMLSSSVERLTRQQTEELAGAVRQEAAQDSLRKSMYGMTDALKYAADKFFSFGGALANITAGVVRSFDELEFAMKHQTDLYSVMSGNFEDSALKLGLAPLEMQKLVAEYRPMIHSASLVTEGFLSHQQSVHGLIKSLNEEKDGHESLKDSAYRMTGNFDDANKLIANSMKMLQGLGTAFSFDELTNQTQGVIDKLAGFAKVTGESTENQMKMIQEHLTSSEVRTELLKLDKKRRAGRVQEIIGNIQYQTALRGTVEAALEAEKALSGIAGMSTRDRFREAAKLQATAATMGVRFDPKAAAIMRKSEAMRSSEDRKYLQDALMPMIKGLRAAQAKGGPAAMVAEAGFEKLDGSTQQLLMGLDPTLQEGLSMDQKTFDSLANQEHELTGIGQTLLETKKTYDSTVGAWLKDPTIQILGGVIGGIGATVKQIRNLMIAGSLPGLGGGGSGGGVRGKINGVGGGMLAVTALAYAGTQAFQAITTQQSDINTYLFGSEGILNKNGNMFDFFAGTEEKEKKAEVDYQNTIAALKDNKERNAEMVGLVKALTLIMQDDVTKSEKQAYDQIQNRIATSAAIIKENNKAIKSSQFDPNR